MLPSPATGQQLCTSNNQLIEYPLIADRLSKELSARPITMNMIQLTHLPRKSTPATHLGLRLAVMSTLAGLCTFLSSCTGDAKQPAHAAGPHAISVAVAKVQQQDMPVYLSGLGSVTAFNTANIKSRVDGQIMRVNVREGQTVKQGELLIEIDARPFEVQLEQAQAQSARDQAQLDNAKVNLDRDVALIPSGSISQQDVDTQRALFHQLGGTVQNDKALIDSAKLQIVYCHITAPFNGRVGLRQVDSGNIVHANDTNPMLVLTQLQPIAVIFNLPEDQLPTVARHMKTSTLQVEAYSRDDQTKLASGKLETIDNQIDPTTGTAKLKAVFDNNDGQLWPNQFVNTNLLLEVRKNSIVVPSAAIQRGPQGTFVYAVKPDKTVEVRPITVSLIQGDSTALTGGLSPGDIVVTDGQDKLQSGSSIEPRSTTPPASPSAGAGRRNSNPGTPAS